MVVTNLFQDIAGRRRWRDAGAVGMGEDAMRREPLSHHGNSPTERFWERDLKDFAYCVLNPSLPLFYHSRDLHAGCGRSQVRRAEKCHLL